MNVVEDFESRPHKAVTFVVDREKERQEWSEQRMPKALLGYSGGRLPERRKEEKGREEGEDDEGREERRFRNEIIKEVIAGIQKKATNEGVENKGKDKEGRAPCEAGIGRRLKILMRRKVGKKGTKWQRCGRRSKVEGNHGKKKDGRKLLAVGCHAKSAGVGSE